MRKNIKQYNSLDGFFNDYDKEYPFVAEVTDENEDRLFPAAFYQYYPSLYDLKAMTDDGIAVEDIPEGSVFVSQDYDYLGSVSVYVPFGVNITSDILMPFLDALQLEWVKGYISEQISLSDGSFNPDALTDQLEINVSKWYDEEFDRDVYTIGLKSDGEIFVEWIDIYIDGGNVDYEYLWEDRFVEQRAWIPILSFGEREK